MMIVIIIAISVIYHYNKDKELCLWRGCLLALIDSEAVTEVGAVAVVADSCKEFFLELVGVIGETPSITNGWEISVANCKKVILFIILFFFVKA